MSWITAKIGGYIAAAIGSLLAIFMVFRAIKNSGRKEVKDAVEMTKKDKTIEVMKDANEIKETNRSMSADARRAKLRKYARGNNDK